MKELKQFLAKVKIKQFPLNDGRKLLVASYRGETSFHISGQPENAIKRDTDMCSPNAIAYICINKLGIELSSEQVVDISNWC